MLSEILEGGQILNMDPEFPLLPERLGMWEGLRPPASSKDPCGKKRISPVSTFAPHSASLEQEHSLLTTLDLLVGEGRCVLSLCPAKGASDHH